MSRRATAFASALVVMGAAAAISTPAAAQQQISLGQSASGSLTSSDRRLQDGSHFDEYVFFGQAGQVIQIDMQSADFDAFLLLWNQNGNELARDDDGGGGLNSRIVFTLPYSGQYRIAANSLGAGRYGSYTVALRGQSMQAQPIMGAQPIVSPGTGAIMGTIQANYQQPGVFNGSEPRWDNKPYQTWGFQCGAGQTFQMDILSDWDNYALVFNPMGQEAARDDDGGDLGLNARIMHTCQVAGVYRLVVTTFSQSSPGGAYTLQVQSQAMMAQQPMPTQPMPAQPLPAQPMPSQPMPVTQAAPGVTMPAPVTMGAMPITGRIPDPGQTGQVQSGQNVQGRLETGDQQMNDGTWADVWQFQGTAGTTVTIELRSEEFDTYLQLLDAQGNQLAEDDDSLGDLDSRITFRLPTTGMYQIVVNNISDERRSGVYTLTLR